MSNLKAPDTERGYGNEDSDDDDRLSADLPPGVQLEWEIEGIAWPSLVVALMATGPQRDPSSLAGRCRVGTGHVASSRHGDYCWRCIGAGAR